MALGWYKQTWGIRRVKAVRTVGGRLVVEVCSFGWTEGDQALNPGGHRRWQKLCWSAVVDWDRVCRLGGLEPGEGSKRLEKHYIISVPTDPKGYILNQNCTDMFCWWPWWLVKLGIKTNFVFGGAWPFHNTAWPKALVAMPPAENIVIWFTYQSCKQIIVSGWKQLWFTIITTSSKIRLMKYWWEILNKNSEILYIIVYYKVI